MYQLLFFTFFSCMQTESSKETPAEDTASTEIIEADPVSPHGVLKIEQVYYAGSVPTAGIDRYYGDQFIQLTNTGTAPVQLGGVLIGDLFGVSGVINSGDTPNAFADDPNRVVFYNIWRIPGAPDEVLLPAGESIVIAHDAIDHSPYSELNMLDADYEAYVESGQDKDDPIVPNLEEVFFTGGYDWLITVFGPTVVILAPTDISEMDEINIGWTKLMAVPRQSVVDTMEALMDESSGDFKRLHPEIDAGFVHVSGTYTGEAVRRKRDSEGNLIDSDDSGADFEVVEPSPFD